MITGELRSKIDKIWETFWSGGIANPITVIEQITYLIFIKQLDDKQNALERSANALQKEVEKPIYTKEQTHLRWNKFRELESKAMFELFQDRDGAFQFIKTINNVNATFTQFMDSAMFMISTPQLLSMVVDLIDKIDFQDKDVNGDLYEYLLSKLASAGTNGQFRTPRHIIRMMVDLMQPQVEDVICDPSSGTCGFLVSASEYINEHHGTALYKDDNLKHYNNEMFLGMEFDPSMIRIGVMNMVMHGIDNPQLRFVDALSEANNAFTEQATLILANPPFKGSLNAESVDDKVLALVNSKKTELLFLGLMIKGLKKGGRCAVIVPDGVLFGSSKAHQQIRKELINNQKLTAVISMPSGVFKPYAGVSTAVLIFTKTDAGGTDKVWFYDMKADGYSLDDKRNPIADNDISDIITRFHQLDKEADRARTEVSFMVPVEEIRSNSFDLSINKYKEVVYEEVVYATPAALISEIEAIEAERAKLLDELKQLL
ncbi:SAM-dependent DNA methyltransferase [Myroides odoratimimus]|uniref:type I restriction-modification system subunit M n=1 Tax=Myroides odoratimimus TaxID=76832 RepID=UPI002577A85F|nr:class I SAM-dependent DNA methyltransferase [Myroides odoratimimus]MDM1065415.1 SAM-dependent DNA methyltransferase [Myroides odoratimimus]